MVSSAAEVMGRPYFRLIVGAGLLIMAFLRTINLEMKENELAAEVSLKVL